MYVMQSRATFADHVARSGSSYSARADRASHTLHRRTPTTLEAATRRGSLEDETKLEHTPTRSSKPTSTTGQCGATLAFLYRNQIGQRFPSRAGFGGLPPDAK